MAAQRKTNRGAAPIEPGNARRAEVLVASGRLGLRRVTGAGKVGACGRHPRGSGQHHLTSSDCHHGEVGWRGSKASLEGWIVAFIRLGAWLGATRQKKGRARVETGRCGRLLFRRIAILNGSAGRESRRVGFGAITSSSKQPASLMPKKNTTCALKKTENSTVHRWTPAYGPHAMAFAYSTVMRRFGPSLLLLPASPNRWPRRLAEL